MDIPTLISAIKEVENDLRQLSSEKVLFQDLNQGGIMWDEKKNKANEKENGRKIYGWIRFKN